MSTLSAPFWCLCQKLSLSPLYFNKTLLHKSSEQSSLVSGPRLNSSPPEAKNPGVFSNNLSNAAPTGWGLNTVLTLVPATWFKFTYAYDQMAKMWRSHDPSIFNKSVELVTKLRKILTYCSQMNIHENSWTVKWRSVGQSRNGGVWNFHSLVEHSTLTSCHCIPTWNTLWSKYLWIYIEVSRNRLIDWIIGHWWLLSLSVTLPREIQTFSKGAESTNLYSLLGVLVLGAPLPNVSPVAFQKSSHDLLE